MYPTNGNDKNIFKNSSSSFMLKKAINVNIEKLKVNIKRSFWKTNSLRTRTMKNSFFWSDTDDVKEI